MIEAVICICGVLVLGGITKMCCSATKYSEEYYRYLRNNKNAPERHHPDYYRYL